MSTETKRALLEPRRKALHDYYLVGNGLAIGPKGYENSADKEIPNAIDVDLDYPGYDGKILPFLNNSQDFVYSSHVLEHVGDPVGTLEEWFRVIKPGGHIFVVVPHAYLYERQVYVGPNNPSKWNEGHLMAYKPQTLTVLFDTALVPNTWRLRHYADNDYGYDYSIPKDRHPGGGYEIECIVEKLKNPPVWSVE